MNMFARCFWVFILCVGSHAAAQPAPSPRAKATLPAPTPERLGGLALLERELPVYERDARDFEGLLSTIVQHHYQARRQRLLSGLDKEIRNQQAAVARSRGEAIAVLQEFIRRYSGPRVDARATPDAMFRLAALYEERARLDAKADLRKTLQPAIALYRRIIDEFPAYEQLAGAHYYLGHALSDAGRVEEGQQAWRALVCRNRYPLLADATDSGKIAIQALPQDHDQAFWQRWTAQHPLPLDRVESARRWQGRSLAVAGAERTFRDPYQGCEPVPQEVEPGEEPRYLAEAWWQLGNYHFDQLDRFAGPYALNRALVCYEQATSFTKPPLYGVALYKRAWTHYRQQRYQSAVEGFVALLGYADQQEGESGDRGTDFRAEAYTYVAGSLTYVDFAGPPADHPYVLRSDVLDEELDPLLAEERMRVALQRVQDPRLIPQDRVWTHEVYRALAQEFIELGQYRNAIATLELALATFPNNRSAPEIQNRAAELYEQLARQAPDRSAVKEEYGARALDARTKLAGYVGATPWTQANREDLEALRTAEGFVRQSMQRVAAERTNRARALYGQSNQAGEPAEQTRLLEQAVEQYRQAATSWAAHLAQDPTAADSYESRFWLADGRYWTAVLQVALGQSPTNEEVEAARVAAREVRDANEDDKYRQPSAYYLVTLADRVLDARYREYRASEGTQGVEPREQVAFEGEGGTRKVVQTPLPQEVQRAIEARDEYLSRVPPENDPQKNGPLYAFQAADLLFVHGHFDEARRRLEPILQANCGKNEWGYRAWEKLVSMSNFQGDAERSRALIEGKSCAFDEETRAAEDSIRKPVRQGVAYLEARKVYDQAEGAAPGPQRDQLWRKAAALYRAALDASPDRDEAPEAAMNGAFAYKKVGEYDKAIAMYELFIARYGSANKLQALKQGDAKAKPPVAADSQRYGDRVKFLKLAYDALANAYVLFFDYSKAAQTLAKVSQNPHFGETERQQAGEQALNLYASLGDVAQIRQGRDVLLALGVSPQQRARADFVIASTALGQWDHASPDTGANRAARVRAEGQLRAFYDAYAQEPAATEHTLEAAYWLAKLKRAAKDNSEREWWERTTRAFEHWRANAPLDADGTSSALGSRQAGFAAEGAYLQLDDGIRRQLDYEAGNLRFTGTPTEVIAQYQQAAVTAKTWYDALQRVIDDYASPEWATAALARQGSLYDSLRSSLYNLRPPALRMFDQKTEALLQRALDSDDTSLQERADALRTSVETSWRERRDQELMAADRVVVDRYARAIVWARRFNVAQPAVAKAIARLAYYTDLLGEEPLRQYTAGVTDLGYSEGMFLRIRPGIVASPPVSSLATPLPMGAAP